MNLLLQKLQDSGTDIAKSMDRFLNNEDLYVKFLKRFLEDQNMEQLMRHMETGNYEEAFKSAHTLKGVTGNLGLNTIYDPMIPFVDGLRDYSSLAQNPNVLEPLKEQLNDIYSQYNKVYQIIQENL